MRISLRRRLLAVAFLGVITCAVCVFALGRVITMARRQRLDRARDVAALELGRVAAGNPVNATHIVGLRAGVLEGEGEAGLEALDAPAREAVLDAARDAPSTKNTIFRTADTAAEGGISWVAAARRMDDARVAWAAYAVHEPSFVMWWLTVVITLSAATLLLAATALTTVVSVRRDAAALKDATRALANDLDTPVPRSGVTELADIGDGIASLAADLARVEKERARLGQELEDEKRLAALGRVAAGVAHEVRNPLAAMKLRIDLLATSGLPIDTAKELEAMATEIARLDRLIADLLMLAGPRRDRRVPTSLGELVRGRVDQLAPWTAERRVDVVVKGEAEAAVDPDAVARAVDNVLRNAVEASSPGESVEVVVRSEGNQAAIRVVDRGGGVPSDKLPLLFEPFFTTKPDGTGLGLALSRAIAKAQGGDLSYTRESGATCFELTFARGAPPIEGAHA